MNAVVVIYTLSDPRTNEVRYVGKTYDPKKRVRWHLYDRSNTHRSKWVASLRAIGLTPVIQVLETFHDVPDFVWQAAEIRWIKKMRKAGFRLTNLHAGGRGGGRWSQESRDIASALRKGVPIGPFTPEHRARISAARLGVKHTEAARAKMSKSRKGEKKPPRTAMHKAHLSEAYRAMSDESKARILTGLKKPRTLQFRMKMRAIALARWHPA